MTAWLERLARRVRAATLGVALGAAMGATVGVVAAPVHARPAESVSSSAPEASALQAPGEQAASSPALWKLADDDTTIYLFGTVHALPEGVEWFHGPIAQAFASSDTLVTEIASEEPIGPQMAAAIGRLALLAPGENLREKMSAEQRRHYQEALAKLGLAANSFDRFKPWYAAIMLSMMPLYQQGYEAQLGVEEVLRLRAGDKRRIGLESVEDQLGVFDHLSERAQLRFLDDVALQIDRIKQTLDAMVAEWIEGDADRLAELMNMDLNDEELAEALLYRRNRAWAQWLAQRLDTPGVVFVAVGAGHLAGKGSLQEILRQSDLEVERVQ